MPFHTYSLLDVGVLAAVYDVTLRHQFENCLANFSRPDDILARMIVASRVELVSPTCYGRRQCSLPFTQRVANNVEDLRTAFFCSSNML